MIKREIARPLKTDQELQPQTQGVLQKQSGTVAGKSEQHLVNQ